MINKRSFLTSLQRLRVSLFDKYNLTKGDFNLTMELFDKTGVSKIVFTVKKVRNR